MLTKGIQLTVLAGPTVPVPLPRAITEALTAVSVSLGTRGRSGFELTFELSSRSLLHTFFLLAAGGMSPVIRVVILATLNGTPEVLIDGAVTQHETSTGENGKATLRVTGQDLSCLMDRDPNDGFPFPAMPPEARVALILAKYAMYGVIPKIIPSLLIDVPIPTDRIPLQCGTDYRYITKLASDVGYMFYMEPGPVPGTSFGYWGPLVKIGVPQPALNIDMDAHTNVDRLTFKLDREAKATPVLNVQEPFTKLTIPIPVPELNPLAPPLGLIPLISNRTEPVLGAASLSTPRAIMKAFGQQAQKAGGVQASGSLNVLRYGRVLKARSLVGVRGAGPAFDGLYYVESVTHALKRGEYTQSFELNRGELLSITPRVPV